MYDDRPKEELLEEINILKERISVLEKLDSEHKAADNVLKNRSQALEASLEAISKSREILLNTLDENNKIRKDLEEKIEELKYSQNMLVQSEKMASLGRLISDISHEVNNPLMIISSHAQLALMTETEKLSSDVKNTLEVIIKECQRAADIMRRILKFAQPSKGEMKYVNISESVETVVKIVEKQFKIANIEINRSYPKKPIIVAIDNQLMQEVFMNILNNAKEAMPERGTVNISVGSEGNFLRIDFEDTGCGISEEDKKKILEPFFTTKEKGTGLGLSICYGIVKAHNGELKFESQLGKGSVVSILLPLGKAE